MDKKINSSLFLYGPPGSGKTTVGKHLAENLNLPFYDLDEEIVESVGRSIIEIFNSDGEGVFRDIESCHLSQIIQETPVVVALGGGTLLDVDNRSLVERAGDVLVLDVERDTLFDRLESDGNQRPLLTGETCEKLEFLLTERADHYNSFSLRIATDGLSQDDLLWQIQLLLGRFHISGMGVGYQVAVVNGAIRHVGQILGQGKIDSPVVVVSDTNVAPIYTDIVIEGLKKSGIQASSYTIPAGEKSKSIQVAMDLWDAFLQCDVERDSIIMALGGGVVGDLAGFAAAVFLRGVAWVNIPTSILAMVDASIGGKTGVDLPEGKNLVGAFYPPKFVLVDPSVMDSLPMEERRNGMAEVIKHGIIGDPGLLDLCRGGWKTIEENLDEIIRRAMGVKIKVILEDPYEHGLRATLNFGHTLGHALEYSSGYQLRHGEAVSIGMVAAVRLSERLGIAETG
jgi:3-dehydroquinate synthase